MYADSTRLLLSINTHEIIRKLEGSCQCGGVEFTLQSQTPVPYQLCACSICRKVGGHLGSVNLGGIADSLRIVKGKETIKYGITSISQPNVSETHEFSLECKTYMN